MKKFMILVFSTVLVFSSCLVNASTEQERQLQYSLVALNNVTTLWCGIGDVNDNWYGSAEQPFVNGVANVTLDIAWGPALYNVGSHWQDSSGYSLFSSYGSIKKIEAGMNYMDFPMYVSYWRHVFIKLPHSVTSDSEVWVNGNQAWFDDNSGYWSAYVATPWNIQSLTVLWAGHGQWVVETSPTFDYGQNLVLNPTEMDPSITVPSQAYGVSYLEDLSWPEQQAVFVNRIQYDQTLGANVLVCDNTLYQKYGTFKVMVALEYYDQNLGMVQYFSRYVNIQDGIFMIPLVDGNGNSLGIQEYTNVRFVYLDPSDGAYKQQYDWSLSVDGGKG